MVFVNKICVILHIYIEIAVKSVGTAIQVLFINSPYLTFN